MNLRHPGRSVAAKFKRSNQVGDAARDLVSDRPHGPEWLSGRVVQIPVLVALARIELAGVPATHRHHDVGPPDGIVAEGPRRSSRQVDPNFGHGLDDHRVNQAGGSAACREDLDPATGQVPEKAGGDLAAAGVVNADEEHSWAAEAGHEPIFQQHRARRAGHPRRSGATIRNLFSNLS